MESEIQSLQELNDAELASIVGGMDWAGLAAGVAGVAIAIVVPEAVVAGYALGVFGVEWTIWQGIVEKDCQCACKPPSGS